MGGPLQKATPGAVFCPVCVMTDRAASSIRGRNHTVPFAAHADDATSLPFANGDRPMVRYPGKHPLIRLTSRPPQLETPFAVFNEGEITPNDAFFVRYHLADIPLSIDPDAFRIEVKGKVDRALSLSLTDLKTGFEPVEIVAVLNALGTAADSLSLVSRAGSLRTAPWEMPAGAGFR